MPRSAVIEALINYPSIEKDFSNFVKVVQVSKCYFLCS